MSSRRRSRALSARRGFRGGSPEAWLWRIVERQALDAQRAPLGVDWRESFALAVEDPQRDAELAAALRRLPPRRRLVVFLRYFADVPYRDTARPARPGADPARRAAVRAIPRHGRVAGRALS